jgi:eukaryotic-like serine/threonine-protein kinase
MAVSPYKPYIDSAKKTYNTRVKPILRSEKTRKTLFIAGAFLSGCIFVIVLMDSIVMPIYLRSGMEIRVPNLKNMTLDEAQKITLQSHLGIVNEAEDYHDSVAVNTIAYQIPLPDAVVKPGRRIHVVISKGPRPLVMPDVVGKSPRDADLLIREAGLPISSKRYRTSDKFPSGIVIDQSPKPGKDIGNKPGVILYISK